VSSSNLQELGSDHFPGWFFQPGESQKGGYNGYMELDDPLKYIIFEFDELENLTNLGPKFLSISNL
jgi:hypothetical protein